jgi:hypothetical protein
MNAFDKLKPAINQAGYRVYTTRYILWYSLLLIVALLFSLGCGISFGHLGSAAP